MYHIVSEEKWSNERSLEEHEYIRNNTLLTESREVAAPYFIKEISWTEWSHTETWIEAKSPILRKRNSRAEAEHTLNRGVFKKRESILMRDELRVYPRHNTISPRSMMQRTQRK